MASEQNSNMPLVTLCTHLPRAGFIWPDCNKLLVRKRGDERVLAALRDHGGATLLRPGTRIKSRHVRDQVEQVLAALFDSATADAEAGRIDEFETPLEWLADLHSQLQWGQGIEEEEIFLELFVRPRDARQDWYRYPREPFNTREHGALAHAIDRFYQATGEDLVEEMDVWWKMTQDPNLGRSEERAGDDPAAAAPHTQGTGAHVAAGEPHPQTLSASSGAGEDEDGDVQMDDNVEGGEDGRVREVRLRLATTNLGEDMEMDE